MRPTLAIPTLIVAICCALVAQDTRGASAAKNRTAGNQTVQNQLKQMEKQRAEALMKGDAGFIDRTTADDYTMITSSGELRNKGRAMGDLKSGEVKFQSADVDDLEVRVYGDTAVVTGRHTQKAQSAGNNISGQYRFTRVYVKQKGQWKAVAYQATRISKP
jgi:ketosteroid isomerase-like protein